MYDIYITKCIDYNTYKSEKIKTVETEQQAIDLIGDYALEGINASYKKI